jgi:ABC-type uncharacterized transport system permease subunit
MISDLHQLTAGLYLAASLLAFLSLVVPTRRAERLLRPLLVLGLAAHTLAFAALHAVEHPPPLTNLPAALSLMVWVAVVFSVVLLRRRRLVGLVALVAPLAFFTVFCAGLALPPPASKEAAGQAGSWPHLHVILASAGLGLLGVAGVSGVLFLTSERRLKAKRPPAWGLRLPSLEALDRVNAVALELGFPLLTCAVVSGMLWSRGVDGRLWAGGPHQTWTAVAWAIYVALTVARFAAGWRGREAAASSAAGFAFLLFAVIGLGFFS